MKKELEEKQKEKALNTLARKTMKLKLLKDIAVDIQVCKLANLDYKQYLKELKEIIDSFLIGGK